MKYGVLYADPPWTFATYSRKGKGRSAEAYYECMSLDDIKVYPAGDYAAKDCVLFLWATHPMLPKALEVIAAWGFVYKTIGFTWIKNRKWSWKNRKDITPWDQLAFPIGTGYWTRANPELCLLATRGRPRRRSCSVRELIVEPRREHSRKPDRVYGLIEQLCEGPYLELFARQPWPGWDRAGDGKGIEPRRWASNSYPAAAE